jgi:hypothetical protein
MTQSVPVPRVPIHPSLSSVVNVVLFQHQGFTGSPPFPADRPMAVLRGHLHDAPPSLTAAGVPVPDALQELVLALLAKNREDRPASAAEVYGALGPWLPAARPGPGTLRGFGPEDPRRPFVLPQGPYPV